MEILPKELHLLVFSYCDYCTLCTAAQVNSDWNRISSSDSIWKELCSNQFPSALVAKYLEEGFPPDVSTWKQLFEILKAPRYAIVGGRPENCLHDVRTKLLRAGLGNVEFIRVDDTDQKLPSLSDILKYNAVLVYSYSSGSFKNGTDLGDLLADYVNAGGGVVVCVFSGCSNLGQGFLQGKFTDMHPFVPSSQRDKPNLKLGEIVQPDHPIMHGVKSFIGGKSAFFNPGALKPGAKLVACYNMETTLAYENNKYEEGSVPLVCEYNEYKGKIVGLNMFPPSSDVPDARFWNPQTDGGKLMANSLMYAGNYSGRKKYAPEKKKSKNILKKLLSIQ